MTIISFDLGGGSTIALPQHIVAKKLLQTLETQPQPVQQRRYQIGEHIADQGGIFVGDIRGDNGITYGLIASRETDIGCVTWGPEGEHNLSDWDGFTNTALLLGSNPAANLATEYKADGHADFYLPARREATVAMANLPHLSKKNSWYWTSTPDRSTAAWAVDFENGFVYIYRRNYEFRVRPFRRFTYSPN